MKNTFLPVALLLLIFTQVYSGVPDAIKYQAVARDNNGNVLTDKALGLRISIVKGSPAGTAVYIETHHVLSNTLGMIALEIGQGAVVSGSMGNIIWGDTTYFIKLELDDQGGSNYSLVGASQLVSVPYSFYAKKAGNGTQWSDTVNNIYYKTGKVGIGTESPKASLEVKNTTTGNKNILVNGETPTIRFTDTAYTGNGVVIGVAGDSDDLIQGSAKGDVVFTNEAYGTGGGYIFGTGVPSQPCVKITDDCKVGIGTNAPVSKLDVKGGDINIEDIGSGVIMKSPDGQCWRMTVSNGGLPVFTSIACLTSASSTITPTDWVLEYNEGSAGNNVFYSPSSFIKNGEAAYPASLPHTSGFWFSQYSINVPQEINLNLNTDSLKLVATARNINGDGTAREIDLGMRNDSSVYASWEAGSDPTFCEIHAGSQITRNISQQLTDPSTYADYALQIQNNVVSTLKNNTLLKSVSHTGDLGGRVKYLNVSFRGFGEVDSVKLYKGSKLIMTEDFNTDGTTTAVWTMP
ncbi:MAG: Protein of unknown function precursor [Bacteroidota bacterium]|nr:Protein of unknown function precursor [Bacteroidota bacterium]